MLETTLVVTTHGNNVIEGKNGWARLTFRDLTFARPNATTTQAVVLHANAQHLTVKITAGFPPIDALLVDRLSRLGPGRAEQGLFRASPAGSNLCYAGNLAERRFASETPTTVPRWLN